MMIHDLVETHCHIIPGIDDGARNVETSLKMINALAEQGAKAIILTSHYYSDSISLEDFAARRDKAFQLLKKNLPDHFPRLIPAAEIYISDYLFHNEDLSPACIGNSKYALIEHPFGSSFSENTYNRLMNLYCDYGIQPILAHIERYRALMENSDILDEYIGMGCLTQVNISSFSEAPRSIRRTLFKYLESGKIHLIGSDCHNMDSRPPEYKNGIEAIIKKCGRSAVDTLIANANQLIK